MTKLFIVLVTLLFATIASAGPEYMNGARKVSNPDSWETSSFEYYAIQVVDGYAVFASTSKYAPAYVAVKASSLSGVRKGQSLHNLGQFSKNNAECLRQIGESTVNDASGFPAKVVRFSAVACE